MTQVAFDFSHFSLLLRENVKLNTISKVLKVIIFQPITSYEGPEGRRGIALPIL